MARCTPGGLRDVPQCSCWERRLNGKERHPGSDKRTAPSGREKQILWRHRVRSCRDEAKEVGLLGLVKARQLHFGPAHQIPQPSFTCRRHDSDGQRGRPERVLVWPLAPGDEGANLSSPLLLLLG